MIIVTSRKVDTNESHILGPLVVPGFNCYTIEPLEAVMLISLSSIFLSASTLEVLRIISISTKSRLPNLSPRPQLLPDCDFWKIV